MAKETLSLPDDDAVLQEKAAKPGKPLTTS
jgi:hypothetical protein